MSESLHGTTVLAVRHGDSLAIAGDGQVTLGTTVFKAKARKVRRLYHGQVLAGFAGSAADSISLFEQFEKRLEETSGHLTRSAVLVAQDWRSDRALRRLEAMLIVGNLSSLLIVSGSGDVIEPDDGLAAIGSGGPYALAAARAMIAEAPQLTALEVAHKALSIAGTICIYTNSNVLSESLP